MACRRRLPVHIQILAEGIDNLAQLDFLRSEGCDQAQGYYYSPPLPADEFGRLLAQGVERP